MKFVYRVVIATVLMGGLLSVVGATSAFAVTDAAIRCRSITTSTTARPLYVYDASHLEWSNDHQDSYAPGKFCMDGYPYTSSVNEIIFQGDGNLVIYHDDVAAWQSGTSNKGATRFVLQTDGNIVIYKGNSALWQSHTYGRNAVFYELNISNTASGTTAVTHGWANIGTPFYLDYRI